MANTQNLDLVKPLGTDHALVSVLNSNSDKIDAYAGAVNAGLDGLRDGLGILADGNTHAAVTSGQFVYVKNHQTLPEGLYQATTNIAANGTLSTSNLAADPKGGLNTLSEQIGTLTNLLNGKLPVIYGNPNVYSTMEEFCNAMLQQMSEHKLYAISFNGTNVAHAFGGGFASCYDYSNASFVLFSGFVSEQTTLRLIKKQSDIYTIQTIRSV